MKPCKLSYLQARLKVYEDAVVNATENPKLAHLLVSSKIAREVVMHEDNFMMALAPYMHANRYILSDITTPLPLVCMPTRTHFQT